MATSRIGLDPLDDLVPTRTRSKSKGRRTRSTVYGKPSTKAAAPPTETRWEENNKRLTFHCPVSLEGLIEQEMRNSGRSKSRIIVDALKQHLRAPR